MEGPWFRPHRFGLGATPMEWQGWLVIGAYAAALVLIARLTDTPLSSSADKPLVFTAGVVVLTTLMLVVVAMKTDGGLKWRWGGD